jgi:predicted  nucleic acid-binding Zn-ribbon protein
MSKLAEAEKRFSAALDALNRAINEAGSTLRQGAKLKAELTLLKGEREALVARIAALEDESRVLAGLSEEVESRLDDAIAEIRQVLMHN